MSVILYKAVHYFILPLNAGPHCLQWCHDYVSHGSACSLISSQATRRRGGIQGEFYGMWSLNWLCVAATPEPLWSHKEPLRKQAYTKSGRKDEVTQILGFQGTLCIQYSVLICQWTCNRRFPVSLNMVQE